MSLEYAILGFLQSADLSGYDLKRHCFDHDAAHFWTADQAQIYRTLEKLEHAGAVTFTLERQYDRPNRKVFSITPAGRERLAEWVGQHHALPPFRDPFLIQLRFSDHLDDTVLTATLQQQRESHQSRLDDLRQQAMRFEQEHTGDVRSAKLRKMTFDAAVASERASIDWLDECIDSTRQTPTRTGKRCSPTTPSRGSGE